jgi:hypothetical protein
LFSLSAFSFFDFDQESLLSSRLNIVVCLIEKKETKVENVAQKQQQNIQQQVAVASETIEPTQSEFQKKVSLFQQQFKIGELFTSSKVVELTEAEAEYVVTCIKHVFPQHILFQVPIFDSFVHSFIRSFLFLCLFSLSYQILSDWLFCNYHNVV